MIELSRVSCTLNGVQIVKDLSFSVQSGQIFGVIGPNGSGKTTTLNLVAGLLKPISGKITFDGCDLVSVPLHQRLSHGIARTFQHGRLAQHLTVFDNLRAAHYARFRSTGGVEGSHDDRLRGQREEIDQVLEAFDLNDKRDLLADSLSFRERHRLELARSIVARPRLLLLDEPAAGMDEEEVSHLRSTILQLGSAGVAVLLVEHVVDLVMKVADRIAVLDFGHKVAEGTPMEIASDPAVQKIYPSKTS